MILVAYFMLYWVWAFVDSLDLSYTSCRPKIHQRVRRSASAAFRLIWSLSRIGLAETQQNAERYPGSDDSRQSTHSNIASPHWATTREHCHRGPSRC
jgi:hypothetical protein